METVLLAVFHIAFVTALYCAAYHQGRCAARAEARVMAEQFSYPVSELMEKLNREAEEGTGPEDPSRKK